MPSGYLFGGGAGTTVTATGTSTARSQSDRAADVVNVKDNGAVGDGIANDTAAIQAVVDAHNGAIFFPPGRYKLTAGINLLNVGNSNHVFYGAGVGDGVHATAGTEVFGDVGGDWVFKHDSTLSACNGISFRDMRVTNTNTGSGGAIKLSFADGVQISNCIITGFNGLEMGGTYPTGLCSASVVQSCVVTNNSGNAPAGSVGILVGPHVAVIGCSCVDFDHGGRKYSTGGCFINCRMEVNNVGLVVGTDRTGTNIGANACFVTGCTFEANLTQVEINAASNFTMDSNFLEHGDNGQPGLSGHTLYGLKIHAAQGLFLKNLRISTGTGQLAGIWASNDLGTPTNVYFDKITNDDATFTQDGTWSLNNFHQKDCQGVPSFKTTVAFLPGNASNNGAGTHSQPCEGDVKWVTDCNNPTGTRGATATGGGSTTMPVIFNGTNWVLM